jgi:hypothetical protein
MHGRFFFGGGEGCPVALIFCPSFGEQLFKGDSIKFVMEKLNACEVVFYKVKILRHSKYFFFFALLSTTI